MKLLRQILGAFVVLTLIATVPAFAAAAEAEDEQAEQEEKIPIYEVPLEILKAAAKVVPGMSFEDAWREVENGVTVYEVQGPTPDGVRWEVEVTADGEVLEFGKVDDEDE